MTGENPASRPNTGTGGAGTGGTGTGGAGTGGAETTGQPAPAPVAELEFTGAVPSITAPASTEIKAQCQVKAKDSSDEAAIDSSQVILSLIDSEGNEVASESGALVDGETDLYFVDFTLADLPSGTYALLCSAATIGGTPSTTETQQEFIVDHGPQITLISPTAEAALSSATPQRFEFTVNPDLLAETDPGAAIDEGTIAVEIRGEVFSALPIPGSPVRYYVLVNFADNIRFPEVPDGETIVLISASNSRGDNAITNELSTKFTLDGEGQVITITSPGDGDIIGGTVELSFTVKDSVTGVNLDSVVVTLNDQDYSYNTTDGRWVRNGDSFRFEFESKSIEGSVVQTNVQINSKDNAGNDSNAESALYKRDEKPPYVSLNPPYFREGKKVGDINFCSRAFYPTGGAIRGGLSNNLVVFRAAVWDRTNEVTGQRNLFFAGTNKDRVEVWIQKAGSPLLKDSTGDGVCDDIITDNAKNQALSALMPTGQAHYGTSAGDHSTPLMSVPGNPSPVSCEYENEDVPESLCSSNNQMTVVAHHKDNPTIPVVYALNPEPGVLCTGDEWELSSGVLVNYQGWVCAAARAHDVVNNRGLSPPIAICLNNTGVSGSPDCEAELAGSGADAALQAAENACMTGCTPPETFPAEGMIYTR